MKRIIYLLIPVLIALTVLSCKRDYDDDYMGSVDERLNATLTAYQNELTSAEHGWMANISTSEGIYRFWMKFYVNNGEVMNDLKGNRVTMITDNMNYDYSGVNGGTAVPGTSSFRLKALQRPTLIFDTYSYLAVLCDPDDNVSHGSGNQGLQTDFEYEIASYEDSVFTLRGRTHRANATLVKATAEEERGRQSGGYGEVDRSAVEIHRFPELFLHRDPEVRACAVQFQSALDEYFLRGRRREIAGPFRRDGLLWSISIRTSFCPNRSRWPIR